MADPTFDPLVFGHRLRHHRRAAGLTLDDVGARVGKPAPFLSLLENGKREPRLSLIAELANALGTTTGDLLSDRAPNERARLEVAVERAQTDSVYAELGLPHFKPTAKTPDGALAHIDALYREVRRLRDARTTATEAARLANITLRRELEAVDNYLPHIEEMAADALNQVGYSGSGTVSQGLLTDIARHFGFTVHPDSDMPASLQSVTDLRNGRIYIPQRDALRTRAARTVVLRTLGHFVLGHEDPRDYEMFLRQRVEAHYFARAVLVPEVAAVPLLEEARDRRDLSVEDLKEMFYVRYSMAAHRFANLATHHLDIATHFVRSDPNGTIWRGWSNADSPLPYDTDGSIIGRRLCRKWAGRAVFGSDQTFSVYNQFVDTPSGTFFEVSHVLVDDDRGHAVTIGTPFETSRFFRGRDTDIRRTSTCPEQACCRRADPEMSDRWDGHVWPSVHEQPALFSVAPSDAFLGTDLPVVYEFLDSRVT